jgi:hypothetical protein
MTQAFNLSQLANRVNTSGQLNAATGLFNQTPVANGGTGVSTVTTGALLLGAGTSAMTELTGTAPGRVVSSSPTGWTSVPAASVAGGDYIMLTYTSPNVYLKPVSVKAVKVTVVGGGGNGGNSVSPAATGAAGGGGGGGGGTAICYLDAPAIPSSPITITAGASTNSFGSLVSATGGGNGTNGALNPAPNGGVGGAGGTGTVPSPGTSGQLTFPGTPGLNAGSHNQFSTPTGQIGGTSQMFSALRLFASSPASPGLPGFAIGCGGNGSGAKPASPGSLTGGTGATGIVIVEEFY